MAYFCGCSIPNTCIVMALILWATITILISSRQLMQLKHERTGHHNAKVVEIFDDEVYHSEEVFRSDYADMEENFKIYVYNMGKSCSRYEATDGKYGTEGYFFKNIRESKFLTEYPKDAHLFFIPISLQKLYHKESSSGKIGKKADKCVRNLIVKYPYWNETLGADHFAVTCVDHEVHVPTLVKNTIRIVCASTYDSDASRFIPRKDISLPSVMRPFYRPSRGSGMHKRRTLAFWTGVTNSDTRKKMVYLWGTEKALSIQNTTAEIQNTSAHAKERMTNLYNARFCICPVGSRITNSRVTLAIHHGCVPVIMEDYLDLPFNDVLDWGKFSVVLRERDVYRLKGILYAKDYYDYRRLHINLKKVKRHFEWNTPPMKFDAFHMVMYDLWLRRHTVKYSG